MAYPRPRRYRDMLLHPLRRPERRWALESVSLDVHAGERIALVGPNGAGKTTLLKLIAGLIYPTEGTVRIHGLDSVLHSRAARSHVSLVVNEERSFYWRLSARENLHFFGTLDEIEPSVLRTRIDWLLDVVGLREFADTRVSDYSTGMKQRLALARGLLSDAKILLLDEPTRSLDPLGAADVRALVMREVVRDRKHTLVVTTNQVNDVIELCDRVCVISVRKIAADLKVGSQNAAQVEAFYRRVIRPELGGSLAG